jgi:hypothetical protein
MYRMTLILIHVKFALQNFNTRDGSKASRRIVPIRARKYNNRHAEDKATGDRVAGAIMGALIGDVLGLGPPLV